MSRTSGADPQTRRQARNAILIGIIIALVLGGSAIYALLNSSTEVLWFIMHVLLGSIVAIWFSIRGGHIAGSLILIGAIAIQTAIAPLIERGLGLPGAIGFIALAGGIGLTAMPRRYLGRVLIASLIIGIASVLVDLFGPLDRPPANLIEFRWAFALGASAIFVFLFARDFYTLDIRTKIVLGILATGGIALTVLAFFAAVRAGQVASLLSQRLESSVRLLAEEQLVNTVRTEANLANQFFEHVEGEVSSLAEYRVSLQDQRAILGQGTYWDSSTGLVQLKDGQYGNSPDEPSSVFVPADVQLNEAILASLSTSAYLDFSVPKMLESNPAILAIYFIESTGAVRYYPNIDLASILPPNFDARERPYYEISAPLFNPRRTTRWTIPYVDATGGGLVVTAAAPIYYGDDFSGVAAADIQLSRITEQVAAIRIGNTGFAYMIDDAGRIISMPPAGYEMYGVDPAALPADEYFKQTVLGAGPGDLDAITLRMVAGGSGLNTIKVNGVNTYIAYYPLTANGYSLALAVPVSEMQGAILVARQETQKQIQDTTRWAAVIFVSLMILAILISLGIGRIIASPIIRLTQTADQIVAGDLNAQAIVASTDEIGTLAHAFNTMTSRLREILQGLEKRVEQRTSELIAANENIAKRAAQFESIAQVARTISSTRDLDDLLPQITTAISRQFGFYHVGIFLLDPLKEYAVLSAANSEGGKRMLANNHKLKVGETGIVGFVTGTGKPRTALDTGADAVFFNNPELPDTRSEIALPLQAGEETIGALDVQSTQPNAFHPEDINILITLADQVSIAIQNARQYEQTLKALAESEALSRQFVRVGWQELTRRQDLVGIRHTGARASLLHKKNGQAGATGEINDGQSRARLRGASLSLPIRLRGEVIGSVDIRAPGNRQWDPDELEIINAILERAALAMENARLLAESQRRAAKERAIGEISAKIGARAKIDDLLKTAAEELSRTLPGAEIAIQFKGNQESE